MKLIIGHIAVKQMEILSWKVYIHDIYTYILANEPLNQGTNSQAFR